MISFGLMCVHSLGVIPLNQELPSLGWACQEGGGSGNWVWIFAHSRLWAMGVSCSTVGTWIFVVFVLCREQGSLDHHVQVRDDRCLSWSRNLWSLTLAWLNSLNETSLVHAIRPFGSGP